MLPLSCGLGQHFKTSITVFPCTDLPASQCVVPENIYTPTMEGMEIPKGRRGPKTQEGGGMIEKFLVGFERSFDSILI